jgi:hypothetical protein
MRQLTRGKPMKKSAAKSVPGKMRRIGSALSAFDDPGLASFPAKCTPEIAALAEDIVGKMRKFSPTALELVRNNYNALAAGFSPTERASDAVFSIMVYPKWLSLFFLQAKGLPNPDKLLQGSGNVAKHVVLASVAALSEPALKALMRSAEDASNVPFRIRRQAPPDHQIDFSKTAAAPARQISAQR